MTQHTQQQGIVVLAPVILLLTAMLIVTHGNAERFIRLQQRDTTHQALTRSYANAYNTLQQILATIRSSSLPTLAAKLAFAQIQIDATPDLSPHAQNITLYNFTFTEAVAPNAPPRKFHAQAVKYSALMQLPTAAFFSSDRLPASTRLRVWKNTDPLGIAAEAHPATPAGNLQQCHETRLPQCAPPPGHALSAQSADMIAHLFARTNATINAGNFVAPIRASHCDDLSPATARVIWIAGDCLLAVNQSVGTTEEPVLLIIENGDLRLASAAQITGLVILVRRHSALPSHIRMAGNAMITGALVTTVPMGNNAQIQVTANMATLARLQQTQALAKVALVPGSWRDFE